MWEQFAHSLRSPFLASLREGGGPTKLVEGAGVRINFLLINVQLNRVYRLLLPSLLRNATSLPEGG